MYCGGFSSANTLARGEGTRVPWSRVTTSGSRRSSARVADLDCEGGGRGIQREGGEETSREAGGDAHGDYSISSVSSPTFGDRKLGGNSRRASQRGKDRHCVLGRPRHERCGALDARQR